MAEFRKEFLLSRGWRKWGSWWYKPRYPDCQYPCSVELHNLATACKTEVEQGNYPFQVTAKDHPHA